MELVDTAEDKPTRMAHSGEPNGPRSRQELAGMASATDHAVAGSTPAHSLMSHNASLTGGYAAQERNRDE